MINRYFRILLWKIFKFEKWHISLLTERKYAQDVIIFANTQKINSIVEIGTGLGDIIRNIYATNKYCLDIDVNVLKANRFLSYFFTIKAAKIFLLNSLIYTKMY